MVSSSECPRCSQQALIVNHVAIEADGHPIKTCNIKVLGEIYRLGELCDIEIKARKDDGLTWGSCRGHRFVLSLLSPVLRRMIQWEQERSSKDNAGCNMLSITLDEVSFRTVVACVDFLYFGSIDVSAKIDDLMELGRLADLLDIGCLRDAVVKAAIGIISVSSCAHLLQSSRECGLSEVEEHCMLFALRSFSQISQTPAFLELDEAVVADLLADDRLTGCKEETLYEILLLWATYGEPQRRLSNLDGETADYDRSCCCCCGLAEPCRVVPPDDRPAAITSKGAHHQQELPFRGERLFPFLCYAAMSDEYLAKRVRPDAARLALPALADAADAAAALPPHRRGAARARGGSGPSAERWARLGTAGELRGHAGSVEALTAYGARLVSGSRDGTIRVWDPRARRCEAVLTERCDPVPSPPCRLASLLLHSSFSECSSPPFLNPPTRLLFPSIYNDLI
jgi:hypothetical protein